MRGRPLNELSLADLERIEARVEAAALAEHLEEE